MTVLLAGQIIAALVLLVGVLCLLALLRREVDGPDVGTDIFVDCGMVHECDGCSDCGAPMVIDENPGDDLAYYGTRVVHRHCLTARRDGRAACSDCARVMVGAS